MAKPRQKVFGCEAATGGGYCAFEDASTSAIGATAGGGGNKDIDRDGSTDRGKEDNDEG